MMMMMMIIIKIIIIIQLKSYLFTFKLNGREANYKVSTSMKKETTKHKQNTEQSSLYNNNTINWLAY
jgi:uncharacterized protein YxeA